MAHPVNGNAPLVYPTFDPVDDSTEAHPQHFQRAVREHGDFVRVGDGDGDSDREPHRGDGPRDGGFNFGGPVFGGPIRDPDYPPPGGGWHGGFRHEPGFWHEPGFPREPGLPPWGGHPGVGGDPGCGDHGGGCHRLQVNSNTNTVDDGQYKYVASTANGGQLQIIDDKTGKVIDTVSGDPHIYTANGGKADFQKGPVTFIMSNGTQVTMYPTQNAGQSVQYLNRVVITTPGGSAAEMNYSSQPGKSVTTTNLGDFGPGLAEQVAQGSTPFDVATNGNLFDPLTGQSVTNNNAGTVQTPTFQQQPMYQNFALFGAAMSLEAIGGDEDGWQTEQS